jgi:translocation and assembly module TamB
LDVSVTIPSGLWIKGRGLEVELAGDLRVQQHANQPVVSGDLRAVRGHLVFLGRTFRVERGRVIFYGDEELNPSLDLVLSLRLEGYLIEVHFQGTLKKPELVLVSEPEMAEADIVSFLLFGRQLNELDSDQVSLLQRRVADAAASYGTAQLEARMSRQLGVDMVTIRRGQSSNALVIGKYLSRRALLRYEQTLEEETLMFLNLEYFLNRHLKLETLIGSRNRSGLEVTWTTEY